MQEGLVELKRSCSCKNKSSQFPGNNRKVQFPVIHYQELNLQQPNLCRSKLSICVSWLQKGIRTFISKVVFFSLGFYFSVLVCLFSFFLFLHTWSWCIVYSSVLIVLTVSICEASKDIKPPCCMQIYLEETGMSKLMHICIHSLWYSSVIQINLLPVHVLPSTSDFPHTGIHHRSAVY